MARVPKDGPDPQRSDGSLHSPSQNHSILRGFPVANQSCSCTYGQNPEHQQQLTTVLEYDLINEPRAERFQQAEPTSPAGKELSVMVTG